MQVAVIFSKAALFSIRHVMDTFSSSRLPREADKSQPISCSSGEGPPVLAGTFFGRSIPALREETMIGAE